MFYILPDFLFLDDSIFFDNHPDKYGMLIRMTQNMIADDSNQNPAEQNDSASDENIF